MGLLSAPGSKATPDEYYSQIDWGAAEKSISYYFSFITMKLFARGSTRIVILMALAIAVHAAFCLSLHYKFLNPLFYIAQHAKGQAGCFFGIYQAGVNLSNGESIYGCETYRTPKELAVPFYHFYRYLPFTSYVSSVFARVLRPWQAYWAWIAFNEILLAACILFTVRLRDRFGRTAIIAASFWLLFSPFYAELYMGQFCFMMTFFIFLILYPYLRRTAPRGSDPGTNAGATAASDPGRFDTALRSDTMNTGASADSGIDRISAPVPLPPRTDDWQHGVERPRGRVVSSLCWVLSVLLKSFTALYTLTLFRIGKKKLAITGIAAAILTSVPYFLKYPQDFRWFLQLNFQPIPSHSVGGCLGFCSLLRDMSDRLLSSVSMQGISLRFFDISPRNIPLAIILAAIFITTFLITVRKRTIDPLSNITLWTLTFFLVFKDIWEYHYVMMIPLFVGYYLLTRSKFILVLFIIVAAPTPFFLYDFPANTHPQEYWSTPLSIMHHSLKSVPTLLFYLWIVRRELREMGGVRRFLALGRAG
jgi:hypothetical protein